MRLALALPLICLGLAACEAPEADGETDNAASTPPAAESPIPVEPDGGIGDGAGPPEDIDNPQEPSAFAQSFPVAIRGTWRATDGDAVTREECDGYLPENMGSVLTIREDSYSYFETGGRMLSVSEREPGRIIALFDTTYADEPTRDEMEFEVDPVAKTLTVRNLDTGERSTTIYRRCPR